VTLVVPAVTHTSTAGTMAEQGNRVPGNAGCVCLPVSPVCVCVEGAGRTPGGDVIAFRDQGEAVCKQL
jgi:hypothetical protein